jgi:hypothetical protein
MAAACYHKKKQHRLGSSEGERFLPSPINSSVAKQLTAVGRFSRQNSGDSTLETQTSKPLQSAGI